SEHTNTPLCHLRIDTTTALRRPSCLISNKKIFSIIYVFQDSITHQPEETRQFIKEKKTKKKTPCNHHHHHLQHDSVTIRISMVEHKTHHAAIANAASHMLETRPSFNAHIPKLLSPLERLLEEILLLIMSCLDYESLYRLSETSELFLRLSFDDVFESDAAWRAFRHTVDRLRGGRVGVGVGMGGAVFRGAWQGLGGVGGGRGGDGGGIGGGIFGGSVGDIGSVGSVGGNAGHVGSVGGSVGGGGGGVSGNVGGSDGSGSSISDVSATSAALSLPSPSEKRKEKKEEESQTQTVDEPIWWASVLVYGLDLDSGMGIEEGPRDRRDTAGLPFSCSE
ncbi:hypothetical protein F5Y17DRAFT_477772, partial [Xylariaceae sp. FL0594]